MRNSSNSNNREDDRNKDASFLSSTLDSRFNQTLRNVHGLLKGRSFPGKVLITRRSEPLDQSVLYSPNIGRRYSECDFEHGEQVERPAENELQNRSDTNASSSVSHTTMGSETTSIEIQKSSMGVRATDSARLMKFTKELSGVTVMLAYYESGLTKKHLAECL